MPGLWIKGGRYADLRECDHGGVPGAGGSARRSSALGHGRHPRHRHFLVSAIKPCPKRASGCGPPLRPLDWPFRQGGRSLTSPPPTCRKEGRIAISRSRWRPCSMMPAISHQALDALRQPLETGQVLIARANHHVTYPARILLAAAVNPCRCGGGGVGVGACWRGPRCAIDYQARLSSRPEGGAHHCRSRWLGWGATHPCRGGAQSETSVGGRRAARIC